jgi:hypothetical protein
MNLFEIRAKVNATRTDVAADWKAVVTEAWET